MIQIHTKQTGKKYWRSLDQLSQTSEFQEWLDREFPANASEMTGRHVAPQLLKLMAASFGLADSPPAAGRSSRFCRTSAASKTTSPASRSSTARP